MSFLDSLIAWDRAATLAINAIHCPASDSFWTVMSMIKIWYPMYAVIAALLIWRLGWKKGLLAILFVALAIFFSERLNNLIKYMVERVRPCNDEGMIAAGIHILENGGGWSFPSGHSNNCFTFALSTILCFRAEILGIGKPQTGHSLRKRRISREVKTWYAVYAVFITLWASLVAISRIMVARHFLLDIIAGSIIGIALGLLTGKLFLLCCRKF